MVDQIGKGTGFMQVLKQESKANANETRWHYCSSGHVAVVSSVFVVSFPVFQVTSLCSLVLSNSEQVEM